MTTEPATSNPRTGKRLSAAWPPFTQKLSAALAELEEDQFLILIVKGSNRFVQFAAQGSYGMRIETSSNSFLTKPEQLDERQLSALRSEGWNAPTGTPEFSTPSNDPDGSPNFFMEFPPPSDFKVIADLTVRTLSEIVRVPHPGFLQYSSFDQVEGPFELPDLGLQLEKKRLQPDVDADTSGLLLASLKEATRIGDLKYDNDGDIAIRFGSALAFVRLMNGSPYARIHSTILRGVEESDGVLTRLNDINANETLTRFVFLNGSIVAIADICVDPFVAAHVSQVLNHFCSVADGIDEVLQQEFGGQPSFVEVMQSSVKH